MQPAQYPHRLAANLVTRKFLNEHLYHKRRVMNQTRYLEVEFTTDEIIEMRRKISVNLTEISRKKDALASLNKQMKGEIALLDAETNLLADKANAGKEMRNVDVSSKTDWNKNRIVVTRLDTGEEIENRTLRADEMQKDMLEE
ncbi:MAG: hypothetical protein IT440_15645 [Phycisphaeraceae bacterium]|nr:hypothetical protein [Phycisphaeraceae bacterium]